MYSFIPVACGFCQEPFSWPAGSRAGIRAAGRNCTSQTHGSKAGTACQTCCVEYFSEIYVCGCMLTGVQSLACRTGYKPKIMSEQVEHVCELVPMWPNTVFCLVISVRQVTEPAAASPSVSDTSPLLVGVTYSDGGYFRAGRTPCL